MYRPLTRRPASQTRRRGTILIVVLALLALFAVIGLSFVFYADSEATAARIHREGESGAAVDGTVPDAYYEDTVNRALGSVIFDVFDTGSDLLCGLRGHSLGGTKFGRYQQNGGAWLQAFTAAPFTGVGTFHAASPAGPDRAQWPNYSAVFNGNILDPEWTNARTVAQAGSPTNMLPYSVPGTTYIPKNPPYTYPDLNNFFLASLSPADGQVLVPSFHRPWLFNSGNNYQNGVYRLAPWDPTDTNSTSPYYKNAAANTDWVTPEGRTKIVRPRPVDQLHPTDFAAAGLPYPIAPGLTNYSGPQQVSLFTLINTKIANGEIIPYPPANADGTYSGDIQNLLGGVGVQRNDSILVDLGLPPKVWNGKLIKPMASILITDLDGMLNLNAHGNVRNTTAAAAGISKHVSYAGYGPWEVNLGRGFEFNPNMVTLSTTPTLPTEADNIAFLRYGSAGTAVTHNPVINTLPYMYDRSGVRLPTYGLVNWDANGPIIPPPLLLPSFGTTPPNPFQISPTFNNVPMALAFFDDNTTTQKALNHPALFNPNDWAAINTGSPRVFPLSDQKRLSVRYAADLPWYQQTDLYKSASPPNNSLVGTFPAGNSYRLDPAHARRMLFTTLSASNDWPGHVGNFLGIASGSSALQLTQPASNPLNFPFQPTWVGLPTPYPAPGAPGTISDFTAGNFQNQRGFLGPVDLNRPLTDYRTDPSKPLGQLSGINPGDATNTGNYLQAWADRHNLARDIFARLVVATGANATVNGNGDVQIAATAGTPDYNALRYLAQVAVNAVDAIDGDDISTAFAWNPGGTLGVVDAAGTNPVQTVVTTAAGTSPAGVVYGVEKPRLVINEAYGELTNNPLEVLAGAAATQNFRVRFWVELMNPTNTPYSGGTNGPLGDGSVTLYTGTTSPYQLQVAQVNGATGSVATALYQDPTNAKGDIPALGPNAGFTFDFSTAAGNQRVVGPANGAWNYTAQPTGTQGFILAGASQFTNPNLDNTAAKNPIEFNPNPGVAPYNQMIVGTPVMNGAAVTTAMEYDYGPPTTAALLEGNAGNPLTALRRHVVLLRRLANPYQPFNATTNPYITVDVMDWVPAFDAVARGTDATTNRSPKASVGGAGFEPVDANPTSTGLRRYAVGKVQPYAGYATGNTTPTGPGVPTSLPMINGFPQSCVIAQNPANPASLPPNGQPLHTFFRNNGTQANGAVYTTQTYAVGPPPNLNATGTPETIMAPFDWFVHFDRPVANQLELLSLQAGKPFEVTQNFIRYDGTNLRRDLGQVPWFGVNATTGLPGFDTSATTNPNKSTDNGLFRALDLLRVKPWGYGVGLGGRVQGRVNINTAQDMRVLQALLDAPPPPWANSTAYVPNQLVSNSGNIYVCTAVTGTGTSAASGSGPTGTGTGIIDGSVTWNYARPGSGNLFNTADVTALWAAYIGSRTPFFDTTLHTTANGSPIPGGVPIPGPTLDDLPTGGTDRPFKPFGIGEFAPTGQYGFMAGSGLQDTLLRLNPTNGVPLAWSANPNTLVNGTAHPYLQAEMVRKMMNNVTTTSDAFAVTITVLFHEVRPVGQVTEIPGVGRDLLGKEAFKDVPGDLRQQFFAVVDRSNLVLRPGTQLLTTDPSFGPSAQPPFFTSLEPSAGGPSYPPGTTAVNIAAAPNPTNPALPPVVYINGQPLTITTGQALVIGVGANQELAQVQAAAYDTVNGTGMVTVTLAAPLAKAHAAGECVSNGVLGTPGPQPTFTMPKNSTDKYSAVVPYVSRVR